MKPILFNSEMVRAILEGRKTVTRRKVDIDISNKFYLEVDGSVICYIDQATGDSYKPTEVYRYKVGDILYVRETWKIVQSPNNFSLKFKYIADGKESEFIEITTDRIGKILKFIYKRGWIPSLHMPKEAARLFLRVTDVRVERLQNITWVGILHEGIKGHFLSDESAYSNICKANDYNEFRCLWNTTIEKPDIDRYGWDANPWVWVISFEQISKEEAHGTNSN